MGKKTRVNVDSFKTYLPAWWLFSICLFSHTQKAKLSVCHTSPAWTRIPLPGLRQIFGILPVLWIWVRLTSQTNNHEWEEAEYQGDSIRQDGIHTELGEQGASAAGLPVCSAGSPRRFPDVAGVEEVTNEHRATTLSDSGNLQILSQDTGVQDSSKAVRQSSAQKTASPWFWRLNVANLHGLGRGWLSDL